MSKKETHIMFTRSPRYRAVRVVPVAGLAVITLMIAAANGCGGGDDNDQPGVILFSPSPGSTAVPAPPQDDALFLPASPSASPFGTPSPIPSPPRLGGF
jgi:hypothetical protein